MASPTLFDGAALLREAEELRALGWQVTLHEAIASRSRLVDWVDVHDLTGDLIVVEAENFGMLIEKKPSSFGFQLCADSGRWLGDMQDIESNTMVSPYIGDGLREAVRDDHFVMKRASRGTFASASGRAVLADGSSGIFIWSYDAVDCLDLCITIPEMPWEHQFEDRWIYTPKQLLMLLKERIEFFKEDERVLSFRERWKDKFPKVEVGRCRGERYDDRWT